MARKKRDVLETTPKETTAEPLDAAQEVPEPEQPMDAAPAPAAQRLTGEQLQAKLRQERRETRLRERGY